MLADKSLQNLPYKIELNEKGNIELSPASFLHSRLQAKIAATLLMQLGGYVFTELAIQTSKGVRAPGVRPSIPCSINTTFGPLPHLNCVLNLFFPPTRCKLCRKKSRCSWKPGALEVWLIEDQGAISYFDQRGKIDSSRYPVDLKHCFISRSN